MSRWYRRCVTRAAAALCAALTVTSCTTLLEGQAVSVFDSPFYVAGMRAVDGPSGLRTDATEPTREADGSNGGAIDRLALSAIADIEEFWEDAYPEAFDDEFEPADELISWDAVGYDGRFCGEYTHGLVNAGYCIPENTIGWDRGAMLPSLRDAHGEMAVTLVMAHEYGHAIQLQSRISRRTTDVLVREQQADCLAGTYMRWVAEGSSPRFTLSTADGLNTVLSALVQFRDPLLSEEDTELGDNEHGSAFERISAFQFGFTDGATACAAIDLKEIESRRGDLPIALQGDQTGEWPVTEESVRTLVEVLDGIYGPAESPMLSFDAAQADSCNDARPSPPVSYCPATNTLTVDLPELAAMGEQTLPGQNEIVRGDNTAYSVLASRYMLAIQHEQGLPLDNAQTALRTACLTGAATASLTQDGADGEGHEFVLAAGDLDEAVAGILTNGLVASDVNGATVPAGFSRIDAFRTGVLGGSERCAQRFP